LPKFLHDDEFGDIEIRRVSGVHVRLKVQPNGRIVAQLPRFGSVREVERLLTASRSRLRKSLANMPTRSNYQDGDQIGKSHRLKIQVADHEAVKLKGLEIIVSVRPLTTPTVKNQLIRDGIGKALRKEAKAYLPRQLRYLADTHGFGYDRVRFTHAKSRWGSYSSAGTVSLNIMLMTLPNELIDYVLLHELNHTRHMNHSPEFWRDLEILCPGCKQKRKALKAFSPYL
jgi:predicted metal-dependent hydrolase